MFLFLMGFLWLGIGMDDAFGWVGAGGGMFLWLGGVW